MIIWLEDKNKLLFVMKILLKIIKKIYIILKSKRLSVNKQLLT